MRLKEFMIMTAWIAFCIGILLHLFYPRYEFLDANHRCNKIKGTVEEYSSRSWDQGWK